MEEAKEGDTARFTFANGNVITGIIKRIPNTVHNTWFIQELYEGRKGRSVYIKNYDAMYFEPNKLKKV